jgi:hypothetical protein
VVTAAAGGIAVTIFNFVYVWLFGLNEVSPPKKAEVKIEQADAGPDAVADA